MSFHSCLHHDFRYGLLRWRYLLVPLIFLLPGLSWRTLCIHMKIQGSWLGCMLFFFSGKKPVMVTWNLKKFEMPILWLFAMGGCLYMILDYFLEDLTQGGLQIIIRCRSRLTWFLSKCLWIFFSCCLYFLLAGVTAWILSLSMGGSFFGDMEQLEQILSLEQCPNLSWRQGILATVISPILTLWALSMLQMTLCLIMKPVISFLTSTSLLALSTYIPSPWILGNGAMSLRSCFLGGTINPGEAGATAVLVLTLCIIMGTVLFRKMDILGREE